MKTKRSIFYGDGVEHDVFVSNEPQQKVSILKSLDELIEESEQIEREIKEMMKKKSMLADKKNEINRTIANMKKLRDDAEKRLQGYSYETLKDDVIYIFRNMATSVMWVDPNQSDYPFVYNTFGVHIDMDALAANIKNDMAFINAIIDVMGGELVHLYRKHLTDDIFDFSRTKEKNATYNKFKRFAEKLTHPKIKNEIKKYKPLV